MTEHRKVHPRKWNSSYCFWKYQGNGEIAKLKPILFAVKILQVLEGHCNGMNFKDFTLKDSFF